MSVAHARVIKYNSRANSTNQQGFQAPGHANNQMSHKMRLNFYKNRPDLYCLWSTKVCISQGSVCEDGTSYMVVTFEILYCDYSLQYWL